MTHKHSVCHVINYVSEMITRTKNENGLETQRPK